MSASRASRSGAVSRPVNGSDSLRDDRAGVEALVHAHQADPRLPIAGEDRGRDRRRPAMARKERWVEVERPVRELQERGRDELAVVGQDGESRIEVENRGDRLGRA